MSKLLSANFRRLWRDKVFWLCTAVVLVISLIEMLNGCRMATSDETSYQYSLENFYFSIGPSLGIFWAGFSCLYLGTEFSDGTIRNKVMVGHSRTAIYFANLITVMAGILVMIVVWLAAGLVGIPTLGVWKIGAGNVCLCIALYLLTAVSVCAILTAVQMLISNKAVCAVVSIFLVLGLTVCGSICYNVLQAPEITSGYELTANGFRLTEPSPNPEYVSGTAREVITVLLNFIPMGQQIVIANLEVTQPVLMAVLSIVLAAGATFLGLVFFKRKDLK